MSVVVAAAPDRNAESAILRRIEDGLRMVTVPLPHLAGLAAAVRVNLDWRVPTMGIFASGRMVANPGFTARLKDNELVFVLAHELLHLALRTHDRARGSGRLEFNYAHDYIINDILRSELGFTTIPAGGLDMPDARQRSAEDIVLEMRRNAELMRSRTQVWEGQEVSVRQALGKGQGDGKENRTQDSEDAGDVLADKTEREMFPAEAQDQAQCKAAIDAVIARGQALAAAIGKQKARGTIGGGMSAQVSALRGRLRPSWQQALQRWIEASSAGERSFARPSRRGAERSDLVMPGRRRTSWMLNVVLDTSGSMTEEIPLALGAIADFCDGAGVDLVRVVQCDTDVTADETVSPDDLSSYAVRGFGGSDLSPAMLMLADDPLVRSTVIVTDGDIAFPAHTMPYDVLWVLPQATKFNPPYGRVIAMDGSRP
ncbi:MAG: VWA-like domain-containing protein [Pseudorhodoplanes sp.]|uniref:vWA domain-containing protein n=1 Tax=Pseudorhodoplanes sp. TaxID=1934341 RepID=UPI003D0DB582